MGCRKKNPRDLLVEQQRAAEKRLVIQQVIQIIIKLREQKNGLAAQKMNIQTQIQLSVKKITDLTQGVNESDNMLNQTAGKIRDLQKQKPTPSVWGLWKRLDPLECEKIRNELDLEIAACYKSQENVDLQKIRLLEEIGKTGQQIDVFEAQLEDLAKQEGVLERQIVHAETLRDKPTEQIVVDPLYVGSSTVSKTQQTPEGQPRGQFFTVQTPPQELFRHLSMDSMQLSLRHTKRVGSKYSSNASIPSLPAQGSNLPELAAKLQTKIIEKKTINGQPNASWDDLRCRLIYIGTIAQELGLNLQNQGDVAQFERAVSALPIPIQQEIMEAVQAAQRQSPP
ncbi:MAG: hypothetical protein WCF19_07085 [Chlamydiales bacterium]